jgi:DNA modification methylase
MKLNELKVEYISVDKLKPFEGNPRIWSEKATKDLKESLKRFGFLDALLINSAPGRENIVLSGNFRLAVAKELGYKEVPCVRVAISDPKKEAEICLRMNENQGAFNWEALKDWDLDLLLDVGFDEMELSKIWDASLVLYEGEFDVEKAIKKIREPKSKFGDLFQLGRHYLCCGDSQDPETVKRLVGNNKIDLVINDPPFNISLDYDKGFTKNKSYGGDIDDCKSDTEYKKFLISTLNNSISVSNDNVHIFYWCDQKYIWIVQTMFTEAGLDNKRVCLWVKGPHMVVPQVAFNKSYEACCYSTRGKPYLTENIRNLNEFLNPEIGSGNRALDDVIAIFDIWLAKRDPTQTYQHPTQKPITLMEKPLKRCTKVGDAVLDLFGGAGATLLACEQLKRRAFLCEINPIFVDVIISRWEENTHENAKLIK